MRIRHSWTVVGVVLILALLIGACQPVTEAPAAEEMAGEGDMVGPLKVAFVYVAPIGDLGWTYAHDQGRLYLEENLEGGAETAFIENVPGGRDAERIIRDFGQIDYDLIITTSIDYMDPTLTVAQGVPGYPFCECDRFQDSRQHEHAVRPHVPASLS